MRVLLRDLSPNTNYIVQFRSNDGEAVSEWSRKFKVNTSGKPGNPSPVTGITWVTSGTSWVATWNPVTTNNDGSPLKDLDYYHIWITDGSRDIYYKTKQTRFDFTIEMNRAAFGVPPVSSPASPLSFRIRAVDQSGFPSNPNVGWSLPVNTENPPPAPVTSITATVEGPGVRLNWTAVNEPDISGYRVYQSSTPTFNTDDAHRVWEGRALSTSFVLDYGITRYYKITAYDVFGTESTASSISVIIPPLEVDPGDGAVPSAPSAPTVISGIGVIYVRWLPVANPELPRYEVHVLNANAGPNFTPSDTTRVLTTTSTSATIKATADDVPLEYYPTQYYVRIVAVDSDGASPPSVATLGASLQVNQGDIAANSVTANEIAASSITGDLLAGEILLGSVISTSAPDPATGDYVGAGVTISTDGIEVRGPDKVLASFPTSPPEDNPTGAVEASINAEVTASGLTVEGDTTLGPLTNVPPASSVILLQGTSRPTVFPTMTVEYNQQFVAGLPSGYSWYGGTPGHDGQIYFIGITKKGSGVQASYPTYVYSYNPSTGAVANIYYGAMSTQFKPIGFLYDSLAGAYFMLTMPVDSNGNMASGGACAIIRINTSFEQVSTCTLNGPQMGSHRPVFGIENNPGTSRGRLIVAQERDDNTVKFAHYTYAANTIKSPDTNTITGTIGQYGLWGMVMYGPADYGANKYTVSNEAGRMRVFNASGADENSTYGWTTNGSSKLMGFYFDGTSFVSLDWQAKYTIYESAATHYWTSTTNATWYGSFAWMDSVSGYETNIGPRRAYSMTKRARLRMQSPAPPTGSTANGAKFYLHRGSSDDTAPWSTTYAQNTSPTTDLLITASSFSGSLHPNAGTPFPNSTASTLSSQNGGLVIRADGTITAPLKMQSGTTSCTVSSVNTPTDFTVTFPTPFLTTPRVHINLQTGSPATVLGAARAVSTTGFTITIVRTNASGTTQVDWFAVVD